MSKDSILKAAAHIFREKGFHAASMQEIAQAVNLQKASLYHHVNSKQEILLTLLDRGLDILIERLNEVRDKQVSPPEKLHLAMRCYLNSLVEYRDLSTVLLLEYRSLEPEFYRRHVKRRDRFEQIWKDILEEGKQKGDFLVEDISLVAKALLGVMNWTITWYRLEGSLSSDEIASKLADLFLQGLSTCLDT
ncbi:MAG: TetR/AcrR family transcriptional regulator [Chloroflexota bacterium]